MIDWGIGCYEHTAAELAPVSEHVVALAAPGPGAALVDLATGTGNAALLAARAGAVVTGLDAAPRLLDVARERAASERVQATFVEGDLGALPFADSTFDLAVSVFGLIFAPDPEQALGEMLRVLGPNGRAVLAVWMPEGPIDTMVGVFRRGLAAATGATPPERFAWHDPAAVGGLLARHGARVTTHDGQLRIEAESPESYLASSERSHPISLAGQPILERAGSYRDIRTEMLAILTAANDEPGAFGVSSPYRLFEVDRTAD